MENIPESGILILDDRAWAWGSNPPVGWTKIPNHPRKQVREGVWANFYKRTA